MKRFIGIVVGIIFLGVGIFMYIQNERLAKVCTEEVSAIVVDMEEKIDDGEDTIRYLYYPVISYETPDGAVKVTMDTGSSTPKYSINDKIRILYNPKNTKEYIVKGDSTSNIFSYVFIGLGVIVTIAGGIMIFKKQ